MCLAVSADHIRAADFTGGKKEDAQGINLLGRSPVRFMQPSPAERGSGVPAGRYRETASKRRGREHLCLLEQIRAHGACALLPKIGPATRPPCCKELALRLDASVANTPWVFHPCGPDHLLFQGCFSQITCRASRAHVSPGGLEARKPGAKCPPFNTCLIPPLRFPHPSLHHGFGTHLELPGNITPGKETFTQEGTVLNAFWGGFQSSSTLITAVWLEAGTATCPDI